MENSHQVTQLRRLDKIQRPSEMAIDYSLYLVTGRDLVPDGIVRRFDPLTRKAHSTPPDL